ncbi:MAG: helix-turn-helix domain-containing protein [Flavobacterium sp.]|nr:helix-turn-helix domain-containing protein [Flavobacterium sp.]
MKTISQIAKECGLHYDTVFRTVKSEQITTLQGGTKINLTNVQSDHIEQVLHNRGYFRFLTLESKMNLR